MASERLAGQPRDLAMRQVDALQDALAEERQRRKDLGREFDQFRRNGDPEARDQLERLESHLRQRDIEVEALSAEAASLREALEEALTEYADHQSWRCEHAPHYYLAGKRPEGGYDGCPCGLDEFVKRARAVLDRTEQERPA